MKGILIEKRLRKSVVMDQNGRFVKTKTMKGWNEGDEVSFINNSVKTARVMSVAAAIVLVFALGLFAVYASNSYIVNLDVNPSIEIKVNAFNNVSEIRALNDDAEELEAGLNSLIGVKFGPAIKVAVQLMIDKEFLAEDGTVVLSIEGKNGKLKVVEKLVSEALTGVDIETEDDEEDEDIKKDKDSNEAGIKIYVGRVTEVMADKAEELGVPVGRMVLAVKAQEEGAEISYEMASMLSVQELQRIRNLSKTINKVKEMQGEASGQDQENGNGKAKQIEAMNNKMLREALKIEGNLEDLTILIESGNADEETIERRDILSTQLKLLISKSEGSGITIDPETDKIINSLKNANKKPDKGNDEDSESNEDGSPGKSGDSNAGGNPDNNAGGNGKGNGN